MTPFSKNITHLHGLALHRCFDKIPFLTKISCFKAGNVFYYSEVDL